MKIQQQPIGRYRWTVCALLFLATTINYIDRQILSLIKPILDEELHWTNEQFGLVNSIFQGAYGIGLLFFGWFVDRFGAKIGYAFSIVAWSLSAMGHSFASSISGFMIARASLGLGEGGNFPSALKAIALWFPKKERAFATSIFNAGSNAGPILAPAIVPWIAYTYGWQMTFVVAGVLGMLWLLVWLPFYYDPHKSKSVTQDELRYIQSEDEAGAENHKKQSWISLLKHRQTWSYILNKFLTDPVWWFFLIWLPDYFKATRGLDIKHSWMHLVTIYSIITVLSIFGGWITGYLATRGWTITRARKTGLLIFALCVMPIVFVTGVGDWWAVLLLALAGSAHQAWSANMYTTVSDMFPKQAVASVIGIGGLAGSLGGMIFPILTGRLLDIFTQHGNVTGGYTILFAICAGAYIFTFFIHHLLAPKFEQIEPA